MLYRLVPGTQISSARKTAELRGQLIAVLGHDLSNPLASVAAGAEAVARLEPQRRESVANSLSPIPAEGRDGDEHILRDRQYRSFSETSSSGGNRNGLSVGWARSPVRLESAGGCKPSLNWRTKEWQCSLINFDHFPKFRSKISDAPIGSGPGPSCD
jgi:hypothetical protein